MKAMVLAAGKGERMLPLTANQPKPLVKAGELCLLEHVLFSLKKANITEVVINVSYFANQLMQQIGDGRRYGMQITYSYEADEPLGTGGGIYQALPLLGDAPFLLMSSDIWTDWDLSLLLKTPKHDAHLLFVENPDYHLKGDYGLSKEGLVNKGQPKYTYASVGVFKPQFFAKLNPGKCSYVPILEQAIDAGNVTGEILDGHWFNVGTVQELNRLEIFLKTHND